MAYELTDHDRQVLATADPDAVLVWVRGHPARAQLALDAERDRAVADQRPVLLEVLTALAPFLEPAARQAELTDAAFAAAAEAPADDDQEG